MIFEKKIGRTEKLYIRRFQISPATAPRAYLSGFQVGVA